MLGRGSINSAFLFCNKTKALGSPGTGRGDVGLGLKVDSKKKVICGETWGEVWRWNRGLPAREVRRRNRLGEAEIKRDDARKEGGEYEDKADGGVPPVTGREGFSPAILAQAIASAWLGD